MKLETVEFQLGCQDLYMCVFQVVEFIQKTRHAGPISEIIITQEKTSHFILKCMSKEKMRLVDRKRFHHQ